MNKHDNIVLLKNLTKIIQDIEDIDSQLNKKYKKNTKILESYTNILNDSNYYFNKIINNLIND